MSAPVRAYKAGSYDRDLLAGIFEEHFKGLDLKGRRILLKPNLLRAAAPSENITTHPAVIEALASVVMAKGARCAVGDSPAGWGRDHALAIAKAAGMLDVCARLKIDFDVFDGQKARRVEIPGGRVYRAIHLAESYFSYDLVFNVPKLKTHSLTMFTLGVKNMMGVVPGLGKKDFHRRGTSPAVFADAIADLFSVVKPALTVLDGIEGMHGAGPVNGDTIKLDRLFISEDTNALDAAVERLCGVDPRTVLVTREVARREGLDLAAVALERKYDGGDEAFKAFKVHPIYLLPTSLPVLLLGRVTGLFRYSPVVIKGKCVGCAQCGRICPAKAIEMRDGLPVIDRDACINCFCCVELCPEKAMVEKRNFLARLVKEF